MYIYNHFAKPVLVLVNHATRKNMYWSIRRVLRSSSDSTKKKEQAFDELRRIEKKIYSLLIDNSLANEFA